MHAQKDAALSDPSPTDAEDPDGPPSSPDPLNSPFRPLDSADAVDDEPEGAVPPGYDWPTHGGYLGCLLGLIAACLVGGFVGSSLFAALTHYDWAPGYADALIVVGVYVVSIVALCYVGWRLGKRFYRAYPQTRGLTWGERDQYVETVDADSPQATDGSTSDVNGAGPGAGPAEETDSAQASSADTLSDEPANRSRHA